ncbi:MAG: alpha/beta hydrolase domain-containing protein [Gammaproteobacteria bacterium]
MVAIERFLDPPPVGDRSYDLAALGYLEEEYTVRGTARCFAIAGERTPDGRWASQPGAQAPFVTRMLVRRPRERQRFSGVLAVEWLNVSAGTDAAAEWSLLHRHLVRRGDAWVGISAQRAGIDGGGLVEGPHLRKAWPQRYAHLSHPGDPWAYDIFTQAAKAAIAAFGPTHAIAVGESQSAAFLVSYINAVDAHARLFDGFLVHGRGANGARMDGFRLAAGELGASLRRIPSRHEAIRADARVPVMVLQSETDVVTLGGGLPEQPDGDRIRVWEIAGAAHADTYAMFAAAADDGTLDAPALARLLAPTTRLPIATTERPVNSGPQQHYVGQAAYEALAQWIAGGISPPVAPRLRLTDERIDLVRDDDGIALGGVRTPWTDVPTAVLSGLGQGGGGFAVLFGTTAPLEFRYRDVDAYLARFEASLDAAIAAGFILRADRAEIVALARATVTWPPGRTHPAPGAFR